MSGSDAQASVVGPTNEDEATTTGSPATEDALARKAQTTLAALLALRGYSLHELACGGFLVARWDRTLHCSDLAGVRAFYERLGGM